MEELKIRYSDNLTLSEVLSAINSESTVGDISTIIKWLKDNPNTYPCTYTYRLDDITVSIYKEGSGLTAFVGKDIYANMEV